jgi:D-tyrosyl-tRNA(Tyr) deacylase
VEEDMRAVVQRVEDARVEVAGMPVGAIERGVLVYIGIGLDDSRSDIEWLAEKIATLRIFEDEDKKMNLSVQDVGGAALVISQFTLFADVRKGRRPSYSTAAQPEIARPLYESFIEALRARSLPVSTGKFQAEMRVSYVNLGPVTILLDSKKQF